MTDNQPARMRKQTGLQSLCLILAFGLGLVFPFAKDSLAEADCSNQRFIEAVGVRESGGRYDAVNRFGYMGKYQFGRAALIETGFIDRNTGAWTGRMGVNSQADYLANQAAQEQSMRDLMQRNWQIANSGSPPLSSLIGTRTPGGTEITASGILAACHLLGCGGTRSCLTGRGRCTDGFGTNVEEYLRRFGGYDIPFAGGAGAGGSCTNSPLAHSPRSETAGNPMCAEPIRAQIVTQTQARSALMGDIIRQSSPPSIPITQGAGTPCTSNELQRVSNQFSYAPSNYLNTGISSGLSLGGPVSGIMRRIFRTQVEEMNGAISGFPNFVGGIQANASAALGDMLTSVGISEEFAPELCGLMTDTVLRYVQCELPFTLPSLGSLGAGLGGLGAGCAGQAATGALYQSANLKSLEVLAQPIQTQGGIFVPATPE